jgi:signal transduction histidine kinase
MAEVAASIAHELKQPLTALITQAQACRRWLRAEPMNSEKAVQAAECLVREGARANSVVDRVRSLFSDKEPLREIVDINLLIEDVTQLLRDEAVRRGITISRELAPDLPKLKADPVQMQQLLLNLLMNGMESTMDTGRPREVIVRSETGGPDEAVITVRDNGGGITEQVREKMFDPFFTTKQQGTGIGLSICRSIVEAHDGRIWADPLDEGTAFYVALRARA